MLLLRILAASVLMIMAAVCGFGFLASFEFPGITVWKMGYGTLGVLFLAGAVACLWPRRPPGA